MERDIGRILLDEAAIRRRVRELGSDIAALYGGENPGLTIVPILSGSVIFLADLIRELPVKLKIALVQISTYPGTSTTAGEPRLVTALNGDVRGQHVLILDDILDSGRTLRKVRAIIEAQDPASVRIAVLLRKPAKAPAELKVDFVGFDIDDEFVVGYGLDFDDHYRNYPHIGVLRPELMP